MSATQKEKTGKPDNEHIDVRKMLNDVMSSYFNDQLQDTSLSAASHEVAKLLEEIKEDIARDTPHNTPDNTSDNTPDNPSGTQEEVKQSSPKITGNIPDDAAATEGMPAVIAENALFSDAFREVEFQSVEVAIEKEDVSVRDEDDQIYSKIVSEALKAVPKQVVATVLDPIVENPVKKSVGPVPSGKIVDIGDSPVEIVNASVSSLPASVDKAILPAGQLFRSTNVATVQESHLNVKSVVEGKQKNLFNKKKDAKGDVPVTVPDAAVKTISSDRIAFLYNRKHTAHNPSVLSIKTFEVPDRITKAMWYLEKSNIFQSSQYDLVDDFSMATEKDLLRVHDESYIRFVSNYALNGGGFLGDSTYITPQTYDIAKLAAGAAIKAGDLVAGGKYSFSFVMTRPPGHHAGRNRYGGFCLFNNAAVLARYLQEVKGIEKIMILDWDAHAGDGTMEIFYDDPTVLTVSLHRDPHGFYPRRGFTKEAGVQAGKGYSVNVEMPPGSGDAEYMFAFDEVVVPLIESFSPGFIICSCGFDAYYKEKNVGLSLTSEGFHEMTSKVRSVHNGNFVLLMEGGYHDFNGQLCHSVLNALEGKPNPVHDALEVSSFKQNQQKQIFAETMSKVSEVKKVIPMLHEVLV
ncbi:histone deacetylase superfamily [Methanolobus psychrophilus R15]|nr:histone deacetylase superfamily [Methanolobus psychrophilus R15]